MSFYGLEQPIIAHLIASCASVAFVAGVPDPASIERNLQFVQEMGSAIDKHGAVFVCAHPDYLGVIASTGRGECQLNRQRWVLAIATREQRNVETANDGQASPARATNGPLVVEVMQAMERFKWTAVGDKREGMRDVKRVDLGSLPGVMLYATDGVYMTLLCYESDLTGTTSTQPGVSYPTLTAPQVDALIDQAIADHEADPDPHPQYTTEAEAVAIAEAAAAAVMSPVQSVAGKTGDVTLVKADVGLDAVDNTADLDKPVSTATATALSGKEAAGTAAVLVTAHEAAADPHPVYVTAAELATLSPRDHYTTHIVQGIL